MQHVSLKVRDYLMCSQGKVKPPTSKHWHKSYRYSSMFAILEVRDFASSRSNFSIPFLEVRDVNFASSRFFRKIKHPNHSKSAELRILPNKINLKVKFSKSTPIFCGCSCVLEHFKMQILGHKCQTTYFRCSRFFDVRDGPWRRINREHRGIPVIPNQAKIRIF